MAKLREQPARAQDNRIAAILQSQFGSTLEQRNMILMIRKARALSLMNDNHSMTEWRKLNEIIWAYWANASPAYVKQRHYNRGINAMVVWSANDIACDGHGQQWLDTRHHQDRAHTSVRELIMKECQDCVPKLMPVHVKVDLSRFIDVMQYFRCPT
eukprot:7489480-Pyramimonas_sp.AAC.1